MSNNLVSQNFFNTSLPSIATTLILLTVAPKLNYSLKDRPPLRSILNSEPKNILRAPQDDNQYSKQNFENLQSYFNAINNKNNNPVGKKNNASNVAASSSKVNYKNPDDDGEDNYDDEPLISTRRPGSGRRSTKKPRRPTRTPRTSTSRPRPSRTTPQRTRTTTTLPSMTTTESSSDLTPVDAAWIIICGFIIFTMQTGFGLLEGGMVSQKNETNIMLKNVADVVLGGFSYWVFGYGITFGTWYGSVSFFGLGFYFVDESYPLMGDVFTSFFFQLSFATTATTIVSGAMAERCNFKAYCLYSLLATFTYSVQARWVWGPGGFLAEMGAVDIAGSGCVHLVGGTAAFVAAWMLGPRLGRYDSDTGAPPMGNHNNALLGLFNLWWGWIAFNAGSTYGVTEDKWQFAGRAASTTMIASIGGGLVGMFWGFVKPGSKVFEALDIITAVLGALVGITAGCALYHSVEAFFTGVIGAIIAIIASYIPDLLKVDDPVGATAVHGFGGIWGLLAVGIFAEDDFGVLGVTKGRYGLVRAGGWYLIGVQALTAVCIITWSVVTTFVILLTINIIVPLRVSPHEELVGLDFCEHGIRRKQIGTSPALSLFGSNPEVHEIHEKIVGITGQNNPAHEKITETLRDLQPIRPRKRKKRKIKKLKNAAMFALAFKKIQSKGNRITPRDRQYIFDEYSSELKASSTESLHKDGNKKSVHIQTENEGYTTNDSKIEPKHKNPKPTIWQRITGRNNNKGVQTDENQNKPGTYYKVEEKKVTTVERAESGNPQLKPAYYDENRIEEDRMSYLP